MKSGLTRGAYQAAAERRAPGRHGRPDANYNLFLDDARGRRLVPIQFLHPADGHVADDDGMVDLTPLCGSMVRIMPKGARIIWSCDMPVINTFIEVGAIDIAPGYELARYKYVLLDPAWTTRNVFQRWHDRRFVAGSLEASEQYLRMRRSCRIPGDEMPSAKQLDGAFAVQRESGHYGHVSMLAHMPLTPATDKLVRQEMSARLKRYRQAVSKLDEAECLSHEELKMLVPALDKLRESHFAERDSDDFREPSERLRKMLWSLSGYQEAGCIFAYAVMGTARRDEAVQDYISLLKRFEDLAREIMPDFDLKDSWQVARAMNYIAFSRQLDGRINKFVRYNICQTVRVLLWKTSKFCLSKQSNAIVRDAAPAVHAQDVAFVRRLRARYAQLRPAMRAKRKKRSDEIARRYDEVIDGAAFRAQQIGRDGKAGRAAIDYLLMPENTGDPFRQFEVEDDELDELGLPTGRKLIKTWRCWRTIEAWRSMRRAGASVRENGQSVHYREVLIAERAKQPAPFVFELIDVQRDDGRAPILPWYIRMSDALYFTSPGHMSLDQRRRKHALCREMKLPDYTGTAKGLLNFERDRSTLARIAMALDVPRRFFPLEEFDHAMMLSAHALDTGVQTWARQHEIVQQTAYQQDWERLEEGRNELDPEDDRGFWVLRKVHRLDPKKVEPVYLECSDALYVSAMAIVALMRRRWFSDGIIPTTKPCMARWKLAPQPWIFSTSAGPLDPTDLSHFLRILLGGIADATLHDFRHASSHRANKNRTILTLIKAGLGQRSERLARYYSRLCLEDRRERRTENANRRRIEMAEMRARALTMERIAA